MPDGKIHTITTTVAAGALGAGMAMGKQPLPVALAVTLGCAAGLLLTPDLDIRHSTASQRLVRKSGGCLIGAAWAAFWWPYAHLLIPRHRHPLSHLPLLGTTIRVAYLIAVPAVLWWMVGNFVTLPSLKLPQVGPLVWWGLLGLIISDMLHTLMDWMIK